MYFMFKNTKHHSKIIWALYLFHVSVFFWPNTIFVLVIFIFLFQNTNQTLSNSSKTIHEYLYIWAKINFDGFDYLFVSIFLQKYIILLQQWFMLLLFENYIY